MGNSSTFEFFTVDPLSISKPRAKRAMEVVDKHGTDVEQFVL